VSYAGIGPLLAKETPDSAEKINNSPCARAVARQQFLNVMKSFTRTVFRRFMGKDLDSYQG